MKIQLSSFKGIAPRINSRYLANGMAEECVDAEAVGTSLKPLKGYGDPAAPIPSTVPSDTQTMYLYNAQGQVPRWFTWNTDESVVPSQINEDPSQWLHFTSPIGPRSTFASLALTGSGPFPASSVPMGVPRPAAAPIATPLGAPPPAAGGETPETRVYVATFVRTLGGVTAESEASAASNPVTVYASTQSVTVVLPALPSQAGPNDITHIRLYRSVAGVYRYVGEFNKTFAGVMEIDNLQTDDLQIADNIFDWQAPPQGLRGLVNLAGGSVAGFVERDVFFSEPYRPFAWPTKYMQSLDARIVGMAASDTTLAVVTEGTPYFLQGSNPESMVVVKADIEQACVSKNSIIGFMGAFYYASPDGLVRLAPGGSGVVSEGTFNQKQWQELNPSSMRAFQHEMQIILFYEKPTGQRGALVYDLRTQNFFFTSLWGAAGYRDIFTDQLYVRPTPGTSVVKTFGGGTSLEYKYVSKLMTMPQVTCFSCAQVEAEAYPVLLRIDVDGNVLQNFVVSSRNPFRLPVGPGRDWQMIVRGFQEVFAVTLAQSMEELAHA